MTAFWIILLVMIANFGAAGYNVHVYLTEEIPHASHLIFASISVSIGLLMIILLANVIWEVAK